MATDPTIPLQVRPPQQERSTLAKLGEMMQVRNLVDEHKQNQQAQAAVAAGGTNEEIAGRLRDAGLGDQYRQWQGHIANLDLNGLRQTTERLELVKAQTGAMQTVMQAVGQIPDPSAREQAFQQAKGRLREMGVAEVMIEDLPPNYDERILAQYADINQQLEQEGQRLSNRLQEQELQFNQNAENREQSEFEVDQSRGFVDPTTNERDFEAHWNDLVESGQVQNTARERFEARNQWRQEQTTNEQDFQAFYEPWLESNELPRNARSEMQARREFRQMSSSAGRTSQQERLGQLYMKAELEGLTSAEEAELRSIEDSMTLVADRYARYDEMTTPEGQTRYVRMADGTVVESPAGLRPQYTAGEREELSSVDEMLTQMSQLRTLARDNPQAVGFFQGTPAQLRVGVLGGGGGLPFGRGGSGAEVAELFRISDGIADLLLRARSGAQINEQEYARLRELIPNPRRSETKFFSDLDAFEAELRRVQARRSGSAPLVTDPANQPAPQSRGGGVSGVVVMIGPDGQEWDVPADNVQLFEQNGYRRR